jgi:hypothetical protein
MSKLPLSVCLIARNEAHNLPGLMASVAHLAQEVVVVDTGSSDGTPAVAQSLGALVLHSPWQDNFSQARNVALEAARADWVLSMDADQVLDQTSQQNLARALLRQDCMAQMVTIRLLGPEHVDGRDNEVRRLPSLRLFRRDARIRYRGRVHEDVAESLLDMGSTRWPDSEVTLTDHGYMDADARQHKLKRNLTLLRRARSEEPCNLHIAYKLATTLPPEAEAERRQVLEEALREACRLPSTELQALTCLPALVATALQAWVQQGRLAEVAEAAHVLQRSAGSSLNFTTGHALARAGFFEEARLALRGFLEDGVARPFRAGDRLQLPDAHASPQEACRWMAWMAHVEGDSADALNWILRGRQDGGQGLHPPLEAMAVEVHIARGDTLAAMQIMDEWGRALAADAARLAVAMPDMMAASARLALASGDREAAHEFTALASEAADDAGAMLLVELDRASGLQDLRHWHAHHEAIKGQRFDTLAMKLCIASRLGLKWNHPLTPATTRCLQTILGA